MDGQTAPLAESGKDIPDSGEKIPDSITEIIEDCKEEYDVEFGEEHRKVQAGFLAEDIKRNVELSDRIRFRLGYKYGIRRKILTARLLLFSYLAGITDIEEDTEGSCKGKIKNLDDIYMLQISEGKKGIIYRGKDERLRGLYQGIIRRAVRWDAPDIPAHIDVIGSDPSVVGHFNGRPVTYKMVLKSVIEYHERMEKQNKKIMPRIHRGGCKLTEEDVNYILQRGPMYDWSIKLAAQSMQYSAEVIGRVYRKAKKS